MKAITEAVAMLQECPEEDVSVLTDYFGLFGFSIGINDSTEHNDHPRKYWGIMNYEKNKLLTQMDRCIPFYVRLKKDIPDRNNFIVRAAIIFSNKENSHENITRCENHVRSDDFSYPFHVIRSDHPDARYEEDKSNGRLSVMTPLNGLFEDVNGINFSSIPLRFMCHNSCFGEIGKRHTAIVLTLENRKYFCFGRKVINVGVCYDPTRDIAMERNTIEGKRVHPREQSYSSLYDDQIFLHPKKQRLDNHLINPKDNLENTNHEQVFNIHVRGKRLYDFLLQVMDSYQYVFNNKGDNGRNRNFSTMPNVNSSFPTSLQQSGIYNNRRNNFINHSTLPPSQNSYQKALLNPTGKTLHIYYPQSIKKLAFTPLVNGQQPFYQIVTPNTKTGISPVNVNDIQQRIRVRKESTMIEHQQQSKKISAANERHSTGQNLKEKQPSQPQTKYIDKHHDVFQVGVKNNLSTTTMKQHEIKSDAIANQYITSSNYYNDKSKAIIHPSRQSLPKNYQSIPVSDTPVNPTPVNPIQVDVNKPFTNNSNGDERSILKEWLLAAKERRKKSTLNK